MFSHSCKGQWKRFLNLCQQTGERQTRGEMRFLCDRRRRENAHLCTTRVWWRYRKTSENWLKVISECSAVCADERGGKNTTSRKRSLSLFFCNFIRWRRKSFQGLLNVELTARRYVRKQTCRMSETQQNTRSRTNQINVYVPPLFVSVPWIWNMELHMGILGFRRRILVFSLEPFFFFPPVGYPS